MMMSRRTVALLLIVALSTLPSCGDVDENVAKTTTGEKSASAAPVPKEPAKTPAPAVEPVASPAPRPTAADFVANGYNLVFISLTNTRADHLGAYGYSRATSPNIDRLAKDALVFDKMFAHASWTLPAVMSLFTSRYPFTHGLMNRKSFKPLPPETPTMIDILKRNGYRTAAFVGDRDYSGKFGLMSRFDELRDEENPRALRDWKQYGVLENTVPPALSWLRQHRDEKFFLLVQGYDTHCPFSLPQKNDQFDPGYEGDIDFSHCYWTFRRTAPVPTKNHAGEPVDAYVLRSKGEESDTLFYPEDVRHMIALYDGEIRSADAHIGKILDVIDAAGLRERTIVVFFADHGDMFGKYGRFMRGGPLRGTFYDDVLNVPFIVRHPKLGARRVEQLAQVIDIAPTLLDMLGLTSPETFRGRSLRPSVLKNAVVNQHVFGGSAFTPGLRNRFFRHDSIIASVRGTRWKLIREKLFFETGTQNHYELFDLEKDPDELKNLALEFPEELRRLDAKIMTWVQDIGATPIQRELNR